LNKWDFLMVFQVLRKPIRQLRKSAMTKPIHGSGKRCFHRRRPGRAAGSDRKWQSVADLQTTARVVVLGAVPAWRRGLPFEVLRYYMLHHRLIPQRSTNAVPSANYDAMMREKLEPLGAQFISASDVFCSADGCLTRIGDTARDISVSDQVHVTEKASVYLIQSIIDEVLRGQAAGSPNRLQ
jgi:SGNH domain (fused to AT3 domains)